MFWCGRYYEQILSLSVELMKLVALSLDLPEDTFAEVCRKPAAAIRLLHYPPELGGMGAGEHTGKRSAQIMNFKFPG